MHPFYYIYIGGAIVGALCNLDESAGEGGWSYIYMQFYNRFYIVVKYVLSKNLTQTTFLITI